MVIWEMFIRVLSTLPEAPSYLSTNFAKEGGTTFLVQTLLPCLDVATHIAFHHGSASMTCCGGDRLSRKFAALERRVEKQWEDVFAGKCGRTAMGLSAKYSTRVHGNVPHRWKLISHGTHKFAYKSLLDASQLV